MWVQPGFTDLPNDAVSPLDSQSTSPGKLIRKIFLSVGKPSFHYQKQIPSVAFLNLRAHWAHLWTSPGVSSNLNNGFVHHSFKWQKLRPPQTPAVQQQGPTLTSPTQGSGPSTTSSVYCSIKASLRRTVISYNVEKTVGVGTGWCTCLDLRRCYNDVSATTAFVPSMLSSVWRQVWLHR